MRLCFFILMFFMWRYSYAASEENYNQNLYEQINFDNSTHKKIKNCKFYACENCRKQHKKCDKSDPCNYCNKIGKACIRRKKNIHQSKKPRLSYKFNDNYKPDFKITLLDNLPHFSQWQEINLNNNNQKYLFVAENINYDTKNKPNNEILDNIICPNSYDLLNNPSSHKKTEPPYFELFALDELDLNNL